MIRNVRKSKIGSLTPAQQNQIVTWLVEEKRTYEATAALIKSNFGLHVSTGNLSGFWHRVCAPRISRREVLKDAFLEIRVRVFQGESQIGESEFSVALGPQAIASNVPIRFETSASSK